MVWGGFNSGPIGSKFQILRNRRQVIFFFWIGMENQGKTGNGLSGKMEEHAKFICFLLVVSLPIRVVACCLVLCHLVQVMSDFG